MSLERWDPFGDMMSLRDAMDRLLHESFVMPSGGVMPGSGPMRGGRQHLPLDVVENEDNFVVCAWMPGVKPDDLQITVQGNTLTIRGETSFNEQQMSGQGQGQGQTQGQTQGQDGARRGTQQGQNQGQSQGMQSQGQHQAIQRQGQQRPGNWIMRERRHGTFYRTVSLPTPINADGATSQFEHGELIITLPKAEEAKPKQIRIGGGQSGQSGQSGQISQSSQSSQSKSSNPSGQPM